MLNYIIGLLRRLVRFLLPIFKTAAVQVAADELNKLAYPNPRRSFRYTPYNRYDRRSQRVGPNPFVEKKGTDPQFHDVLLVAFDLTGPSANLVHEWLHNQMPATGDHMARGEDDETVNVNLDSWWVANDERFDGSDCDSAVFVSKGNQKTARKVLRLDGLVK